MRTRGAPRQRDKQKLATALVAVALLTACSRDQRGADSEPLSRTAEGSSEVAGPSETGQQDWFVEQAQATGLNFVHFNGMSGEFYFPETIPAGVALLDYDNDGDLDVYLVQGQMLGQGKTLSQARFQPAGPL